MSEHDAEYFRHCPRAQGIPEREGLEQLLWPRDLFGDYASIAELMAEAAELSGPGECDIDFPKVDVELSRTA